MDFAACAAVRPKSRKPVTSRRRATGGAANWSEYAFPPQRTTRAKSVSNTLRVRPLSLNCESLSVPKHLQAIWSFLLKAYSTTRLKLPMSTTTTTLIRVGQSPLTRAMPSRSSTKGNRKASPRIKGSRRADMPSPLSVTAKLRASASFAAPAATSTAASEALPRKIRSCNVFCSKLLYLRCFTGAKSYLSHAPGVN